MQETLLKALLQARQRKQPVAVITDLASGAQALTDGTTLLAGAPDLTDGLTDAVSAVLRADKGRLVDLDQDGQARQYFIHPHNPPLRLVIIGAVHIAQSLVPMARLANYAVTVIDPRQAFATAARFPNASLSDDWPDDALTALRPDRRTALVTLTHDPKMDDPALITALRSDCFYIGALGSTRTHALRRERLLEQGFTAADLDRIHGPVGLTIGAQSPAEIATAILAEMTAVLRQVPPMD